MLGGVLAAYWKVAPPAAGQVAAAVLTIRPLIPSAMLVVGGTAIPARVQKLPLFRFQLLAPAVMALTSPWMFAVFITRLPVIVSPAVSTKTSSTFKVIVVASALLAVNAPPVTVELILVPAVIVHHYQEY